MDFTKWQGCGNDFVLVDCMESEWKHDAADVRRICDRHYGIGADGILLVLPSRIAAFRMRILNADGSEAEMCGNGIRCVARYARDFGLTDKEELTIETGAGVLVPHLIVEAGCVTGVRVDMGEPHLAAEEIPVLGFGKDRVVNAPIAVLGKEYRMTCVSMGNPHCVIFVEDAEAFPIADVGSSFEHHEAFPKKTNTEFAEVRDRTHIRMRVWERGAAVTLACGTGACATAVAAILNGKTERKVKIELDGGKLMVEWAANNHVFMTGPAEMVYSGKL